MCVLLTCQWAVSARKYIGQLDARSLPSCSEFCLSLSYHLTSFVSCGKRYLHRLLKQSWCLPPPKFWDAESDRWIIASLGLHPKCGRPTNVIKGVIYEERQTPAFYKRQRPECVVLMPDNTSCSATSAASRERYPSG